MPAKRSNKTARVLNLIATPNEAAPIESDQPATPTTPEEPQSASAEPSKAKKRASATRSKKTSKAAASEPETIEPVQEPISEALEAPIAAAQPQASPIQAPTPQPVVPIVQTVREKEQQVSDDIKSGLLQALIEAEEPAQPCASSAADDAQELVAADISVSETEESPVAATENAAVSESESTSEPDAPQSSASEITPPAVEPAAPVQPTIKMPQPEARAESIYTPAGEQDVEYTNVLQELVEETAVYYTTNMLQCQCQRCITDMKALALTNLPSKYVVLEKSKRAAYMSVYAARYDKELSVQMMRACVIINEHPHH